MLLSDSRPQHFAVRLPTFHTVLRQIALLPVLVCMAGCSGGETDSGTSTSCSADLASIQKEIFQRSCTQQGCHGAADAAAFLNLAATDIAAELVGIPSSTCDGATRVVPGSPEQSFLYQKITEATPACGSHMPPGGALSAEEQACIAKWITAQEPPDGGPCETCGGNQCVDLQYDPAHCGTCDTSCPSDSYCVQGECLCTGAGLTVCGSSCVDTSQNSKHCGSCDNPCAAGSMCTGGQCDCTGGLTSCGGTCVDISSDPAHCGGCGNACGSGLFCNGGMCAATCGTLTQCGGACVDTDTSLSHCGGCGNACPTGASCVGGMCQCPAGATACAGVCIDTTSDPANCGACGNMCEIGQTCSGSSCSCGNASVSFSGAVQPVFTASCTSIGCHSNLMPQQGLNLTAGNAYQSLVNVNATQCTDGRKRVLPGQPSQSYLIHKMQGVNLCFGTKMPKLGSVQTMQVQTIANWICAGAPNN